MMCILLLIVVIIIIIMIIFYYFSSVWSALRCPFKGAIEIQFIIIIKS